MLRILVAAALIAAALPAHGEERSLELTTDATEISFLLDAMLHQVRGTARLTSGFIRFDPATGAASGEVLVDARSLETGKPKRDRKMHQKVLESERYPEIRLAPTRLEGDVGSAGESDVTLHGEMTLHGASHPLSLPTRLVIGGTEVELTARFTVPYVAWGLDDPSSLVLRVGKEVEVEIRATVQLDAPLQ